MKRTDFIFDTLNKTLVTGTTIRYRRAHGDARRGYRGGDDADRGGRGLWSGSEDGADLTATMYSVLGTLVLNGIDALRWLEAWLEACAKNGGKPPDDLSPWLPWTMSEKRRREFMTPE